MFISAFSIVKTYDIHLPAIPRRRDMHATTSLYTLNKSTLKTPIKLPD